MKSRLIERKLKDTDSHSVWTLVLKLGKQVLELVFPSNIYCICCDNLIDNSRSYALCDECLQTIHWANGRTCNKCGKALVNEHKNELCHDCQQNTHLFERGFTCMHYGTKEKEMMHRFKFNGAAYMGSKLGKIMLDRIILENVEVDCVIPVPMHKKKQDKRGYNQSELMAKEVAKGLSVPYNGQVLVRNKYKAPMNKLDSNQRRMNIIDCYSIRNTTEKSGRFLKMGENLDNQMRVGAECAAIKGKSILLIDDVYTTGSTVDECSKVLLEAGADKVYVLTLAAGVN